MLRFLLVLLLVVPASLYAQFTYVIDQSIPVKDADGHPLQMPWAGGLNAAQYNTLDINQDGHDDLVLFDRMANKVITFLNEGNTYRYAPEFEELFPDEITNWLLLRDYNCDGRKDIFTGHALGIQVYTNVTTPGNHLTWEPFFFYSGPSNPKSPVILTQGFTSKINLQIQYDDLPAISDIDNDGDLDIMTVRFAGNGTIEFHRNLSIEKYGTCDSLDFERITTSWGNVRECSCGEFAFNGDDCNSGGRTEHAGGKALLALDTDGDQQQDMLFSEAECTQLYLLKNEGTTDDPLIDTALPFPPAVPANFVRFPAAFFEDVDFDGIHDLIATPNLYAREFLSSDLKASNWFYKNTGTNAHPVFTFIQPDFLQEHMIDVGDNAIPAFGDYDGDGDYDMLISCHSSNGSASTIALFENTGQPDDPAFQLVTDDYLNFSTSPFFNLKIQLLDINKDNTIDLVFTATSLLSGTTNLYYVPNKSSHAFDFSGQSLVTINFSLTSGENLLLTDVDGDGLPDILAGRSNGALEFWKNTGTAPLPSFTLQDDRFLSLGSSVLRQNMSCTTADLDADGKTDLILADQSGVLKIVSDYRNAARVPDDAEYLVYNPVLQSYNPKNLGGRVWPMAVNLFNSNRPAIVVGSILGGLQVLRNDEGQSLPHNPVVDIYPNPAAKTSQVNIRVDRPATVQVFTTLGQQVSAPVHLQPNEIHPFQLSFLPAGMYILKFTAGKRSLVKRMVIY